MSEKQTTMMPAVSDMGISPFSSLELYKHGRVTPELLDEFEAYCFDMIEKGMPGFFEVEIPTTHHFTPHTYVREAVMPKGSLIIGHAHKDHHHCVVLKGRMSILNPDKSVTEIVAPATFLAGPGRKVGFMHTDVIMQNVHPTEHWPVELGKLVEAQVQFAHPYHTFFDAIEDHIYNQTEAFKRHRERQRQLSRELYAGLRCLTG